MPNADKIGKFLKSWDRKNNWSGKLYNLLDNKIRIILNICQFTDIAPNKFYTVLPRILNRQAEYFYIYYIGPKAIFSKVYITLKDYFEIDINCI